MDAAGNQWAMYGWAAGGVTTTNTGRVQLAGAVGSSPAGACIVGASIGPSIVFEASFVSMDAVESGTNPTGGFTVDITTATTARNMISLCLNGGAYQVGHWTKSTAATPPTAVDTITTTSMTPIAVLFASDCYPVSTSVLAGYRVAIGGAASNGANVGLIVTDKSAATTTAAYKYNNSYNSLLIADDDTETTQAYGYATSFTSGSFKFAWTNNNTTATQICYVAFGH
jgi:hypothetical protein